jgi:hypothetical protein
MIDFQLHFASQFQGLTSLTMLEFMCSYFPLIDTVEVLELKLI